MGHYFLDTQYTICPRSNYPFNIVTYFIKLVTTSWTSSKRKFLVSDSYNFTTSQAEYLYNE